MSKPTHEEDLFGLLQSIAQLSRDELNDGDRSIEAFRRKWTACGKLGLPGLNIPEVYGGAGLNARQTSIVLEQLGYSSTDAGFNFALAAHLLACVTPIHQYGTEEQRRDWLPALCDGRHVAANAMTENSAGSDVYDMATTATPQEDGYVLDGHKSYCSNGPIADVVLTYAITNANKGAFGGISAFVLHRDEVPYSVSEPVEKIGLESCRLGEISFDRLAVSRKNCLGEIGGGFRIFQSSMTWERICLGALHLGEMERLLKKAVIFANQRQSGGESLSKKQAVTHPLANLKCRIAAGRQLLYLAADKLDNGKSVAMESSMVKLMISETYKDFALQLHQLYAGQAFRAGNEVEACVRSALAATLYSGTSEVQRNIIARYIGLK